MNALEKQLGSIAGRVGSEVSRRDALRRLSLGAASIGFLVAGGFTRTAAAAEQGTGHSLLFGPVGPTGGKDKLSVCLQTCYLMDCCTNGCCLGHKLYRCENSCDGSYWYQCVIVNPPCPGSFCYSESC